MCCGEALPLLGEVPSAHTGERGRRGGTRCRAEKTGRNSFLYWQSLSHGDPSVSLTLDSSPKRGAKGVDDTHIVQIGATAYPSSVIPPKGIRRQSRRRERAKPDVGIRFSLR